MSFLLVSLYLENWDEYMVYTMIIPIFGLFLIGLFFVQETPHYLMHKVRDMLQYR